MKILKDAGDYEITRISEFPIKDIADAARTCYQTQDKSNKESDYNLVKRIMSREHDAMLEFADMTVRFDLICRGFTHEDVRHRLSNFAQESTRYVDESDFLCVVPPHKDDERKTIHEVSIPGSINKSYISLYDWFKMNEDMYRSLRENGWKPEDARQVLPIAIKSQIVHKANMREWRHIFKMRCDKPAHWEIRGVMCKLLKHLKSFVPLLFDDFHFRMDKIKGEYAVKVLSVNQLKEHIENFILAGGDLNIKPHPKVCQNCDDSINDCDNCNNGSKFIPEEIRKYI